MKKSVLKPFDWFLIVGVIACSVAGAIFDAKDTGSFDWLGTVTAISGLFCVVLVSRGSIVNYFFGLVNVSLYAWISYKSNLLGDCLLNALYYVPMQFIGWFAWMKRKNAPDSTVIRARRLSTKGRLILTAVCVVSVTLVGVLLASLKAGIAEHPFLEKWHLYSMYPYKDALTTMFAIIAQYLMVRAIMEQWVLWITMDVVSLIIWTQFALNGTPHAILMVVMYVFYTANAINGMRVWIKLSRPEEPVV